MDSRAKALIEQGDQLFSKRLTFLSLLQEIADNFYPERADFTVSRTLGEDFAANLTTSYPLLMRRELGNSFSAMLRRQDMEWFRITVDREERLDNAGREWLEWATSVQRRAMYDRQSQFVRATKEGDHDFAAFGQCVISEEINYRDTALLYRCWHLRDLVWCEAHDGSIGERHHKLKPSVRWLAKQFGKDKLHQNLQNALDKNPLQEVCCRRIVIPSEDYGDGKFSRFPWVSIYVDTDNQCVIDERGSPTGVYVIPRWQTVSGSQYAYSPAVVAGLPDARLLQAMTLTLLEAGEMAVRPPMLAVQEAIAGGVKLYAGGITQVDAAYDERLGEVLRPVTQDIRALPWGLELSREKQEMLASAFYLNKLRAMPPKEVTAYEASKWWQDWIREAVPLFEPMESEYNGALCDQTFEDLMRVNAFGAWKDIPQSIRGSEVRFKFQSPLSDAIDRQKGQKFVEAKALITEATQLDPSTTATIDARIALREALSGIGIPAKWMRDEEAVEAHAQQLAAQQQMQQQAAVIQQGAETAKTAGEAEQALNAAA
jgi:Bacteriophage head to tail connecting protein.